MKPRFSAMQMAVRPKPVEAMLATMLVSVCADVAAVFDQAGLRIGLLPEEEEVGALESSRNWSSWGESALGVGGGAGAG